MKSRLLLLALLLGGSPLRAATPVQELADVNAQRLEAIDKATQEINGKFRQRYLALLQKAAAAKDARLLTWVRIALANVSTISPEQYAIDALAGKKWTFEVPRVGHTSARIFYKNGKWKGVDGKSEGAWKIDRTGLKIFLASAPDRPEIFKFPMRAERWFGVGSQQDVLYLSLAPDFEDIGVGAP